MYANFYFHHVQIEEIVLQFEEAVMKCKHTDAGASFFTFIFF